MYPCQLGNRKQEFLILVVPGFTSAPSAEKKPKILLEWEKTFRSARTDMNPIWLRQPSQDRHELGSRQGTHPAKGDH